MLLDGKLALITGGGSGIGEGIAKAMAENGAQSFVALLKSAAYTTSKGGVRALTKALAVELSPQGVRVNAIGSGMIVTPLNADARRNPDYVADFAQGIPVGRLGEPADIAGPAVFLASDLARYVTGMTLPVDDGFLAY